MLVLILKYKIHHLIGENSKKKPSKKIKTILLIINAHISHTPDDSINYTNNQPKYSFTEFSVFKIYNLLNDGRFPSLLTYNYPDRTYKKVYNSPEFYN